MQPLRSRAGRSCWRDGAGGAWPELLDPRHPCCVQSGPWPHGQGEDSPVRASHQRGPSGLHDPDVPTAKRAVGAGREARGAGEEALHVERAGALPCGPSARRPAAAFPSTELTFPPLFRWPPPALPPPRPPSAAGSPSHRTPCFGPAAGAGRARPLAVLCCGHYPAWQHPSPLPPACFWQRGGGVKAEANPTRSPSVTWRKVLLQTSPTRALLQSDSPLCFPQTCEVTHSVSTKPFILLPFPRCLAPKKYGCLWGAQHQGWHRRGQQRGSCPASRAVRLCPMALGAAPS